MDDFGRTDSTFVRCECLAHSFLGLLSESFGLREIPSFPLNFSFNVKGKVKGISFTNFVPVK